MNLNQNFISQVGVVMNLNHLLESCSMAALWLLQGWLCEVLEPVASWFLHGCSPVGNVKYLTYLLCAWLRDELEPPVPWLAM